MEIRACLLRIIVAILLFVFCFYSFGQKPDTVWRDTLVIIQKQMIVSKANYSEILLERNTDVFVSPVFLFNTYNNAKSNDSLYDLTHDLNMGIQFGVVQSVGIKDYFAKVGLSYSYYKEKFQYCRYQFNTDTVMVLQGEEIAPVVIRIHDSLPELIRSECQYHYMSLPILLGKRISIDKWSISGQAGVIISLLLSAQNKVYTINDEELYVSKKDYRIFNYAMHASVGIGCSLSDKIKAYIQPWISYMLAPNFKTQRISSVKTHMWGSQCGLQIIL